MFLPVISLLLIIFQISSVECIDSSLTAGDPSKFKSDGIIIIYNNTDSAEINSTSTPPKSYGWYEYKQCDSRWANQELGIY